MCRDLSQCCQQLCQVDSFSCDSQCCDRCVLSQCCDNVVDRCARYQRRLVQRAHPCSGVPTIGNSPFVRQRETIYRNVVDRCVTTYRNVVDRCVKMICSLVFHNVTTDVSYHNVAEQMCRDKSECCRQMGQGDSFTCHSQCCHICIYVSLSQCCDNVVDRCARYQRRLVQRAHPCSGGPTIGKSPLFTKGQRFIAMSSTAVSRCIARLSTVASR